MRHSGLHCIMTSQTVGPAGKFIGSLGHGGLTSTIRIARGTFPVPVQLTVSEPLRAARPAEDLRAAADTSRATLLP